MVVGARPNFMKAAPVFHALEKCEGTELSLLHTGQHYDRMMSDSFLEELGLRAPDVNLGVGSGSHGKQTAEVLSKFESYLLESPQDLVIVAGDVNSTVAAALASVKLHTPVAHVESGLRSGDRRMPEEINRILTDSMSAMLFVTEPSGVKNLAREGVDSSRVHLVGNTMIDTLKRFEPVVREKPLPIELPSKYALVTLHRPSNVDSQETLRGILDAFFEIAETTPLCWPVHPRTRKQLETFGFWEEVENHPGVVLAPPFGYVDFLGLTAKARLVLTDSGGIQEEALVLRVPVVTLRENTERPVTIDGGGNILTGPDPEKIRAGAKEMLSRDPASFQIPETWDGQAGERVAREIVEFLQAGGGL